MIPSLAPCFTGTLLRFRDALALPGQHASSIPGRDLLDPTVAEDLLGRFAALHPGGDRRALVSMWTHWHFGALIIPTTAAILLLDRNLPVDLDRVRIAVQPDGRTEAVILPDDGADPDRSCPDPFRRLFDGHVEPLIRHFAGHFRVSPRLLWGNAATILDWTIEQTAAFDGVRPDALARGRALLGGRADRNGPTSPMDGAVQCHVQDGETIRRRKVCCLRYLLPGMEDCGSLCPVPPERR